MLYATIVGINCYRDSRIRDLRYASSDAQCFYELLSSRIRPEERQLSLLCDRDATLRNIRGAIGTDLAQMSTEGDICLIYFAGHGSPETNAGIADASAYLVAHDTEFEDIYATGLDMERDLTKAFERVSKASIVLGLLDCCFSGRTGGRTFEGPKLHAVRPSNRGTPKISLQNLPLGEGRAFITACGSNQVAREDSRLRHGVFTHYILDVLTRPRDGVRTIDVALLYAEVSHLTHRHTKGRQTPTLNGRLERASLPVLALT